MKPKRIIIPMIIFASVLALGIFALQTGADDSSSCLDCHANPDVMKALVVVPKLGGGEGEG